jgi:hypothetical protein
VLCAGVVIGCVKAEAELGENLRSPNTEISESVDDTEELRALAGHSVGVTGLIVASDMPLFWSKSLNHFNGSTGSFVPFGIP